MFPQMLLDAIKKGRYNSPQFLFTLHLLLLALPLCCLAQRVAEIWDSEMHCSE